MKKIFKKITVLLVSIVMLASAFSFVGCKDNEEGKIVYSITLDASSKSIALLDEFYLVPTYVEVPNTSVVFTSSNEDVISVDEEGKVKGETLGSATITATYGKASATCNVTVSLPQEKPYLSLQGVGNITDEIYIQNGMPFNLNTFVNFKGQTFDDAEVRYTLNSEGYGALSGNVFTPELPNGVASAQVSITVSASWRGVSDADAPTLVETIKLNVVDVDASDGNSYVLINNTLAYPSSITLYKAQEVDGIQFDKTLDFVARAMVNGELSEDTAPLNITTTNDNIVEIVDDKITAINKGTTEVIVELIDAGANSIPEITRVVIPVEVKYPVIDKTEIFNLGNVSAKDGYDLTEVQQVYAQGAEHTITSAYQNYGLEGETALTVESGVVKGFIPGDTRINSAKITLFTDGYGYTFDADIFTDVITTPEELELALKLEKEIIKNAAGADREIAGKAGAYILGANITYTSTWVQNVETNYGGLHTGIFSYGWESNDEGFRGYFDGNGHTVVFSKIGAQGIFGRVRDGAIIKNVDFEIDGMELSDNGENVALGIAIGHSYNFGSGANSLANRTIEKTYVSNIAIRLLPSKSNQIKEFDGIFAIINNAAWYGDIYREVKLTDIYLRLNSDVSLQNQSRDDENYGLIASMDFGNVLGIRDYIQDAVENVVIISGQGKEALIVARTVDSWVLEKRTGSNPAAKVYGFYAQDDVSLLSKNFKSLSGISFSEYQESIVGKDDPSRTDEGRFIISGVKRFPSATTFINNGLTHVGSWLVAKNGNTVTYDIIPE